MTYIAHLSEDQRMQTVLTHLEGTAELCSRFARPFGAEELGRFTGVAHDIGKYSDAFQRRLHGGAKVDHATAGAYECYKQQQPLAAFCAAGHHGGLPDGGSRGDGPDMPTLLGRMCRARMGKLEAYESWKQEVSLPSVKAPVFQKKSAAIDSFFFTRMLYSCLVDADYLDTEHFMEPEAPLRGNDTPVETLYRRLEQYISNWFPPRGEVNALRCAVLENCIEQGESQKPGLFTLTVPTGGGKTVASLAFALRHACAHGKKRIVYVIPYTSIIEQTAAVFRDILGEENVLEHHSNIQYETDEKGELSHEDAKRMRATENWDMPVIVTTAVQFFESLYSNRSSQCRKLHNLADSVIIFDEAQMLPLPYLRPCVCAVAQLTARYGVSAVLCTATQPALTPLLQEFLPGADIPELCPESIIRAPVFRRVRFRNAGQLTWEQLQEQLRRREQVLCIVNSRKNAQLIFAGLPQDSAYHLSTLMAPVHRKSILTEIRQRLYDGLPCRVISTSLIEAGVDLDFPAVFREEAGLDSVLQAAGRCNREGKRPAAESIVTVFRAQSRPPQIFETNIAAGQEAMERYEDFSDPDAISCYFHALLDLKGQEAQDQKKILPRIQEGDFPFRTIAERLRQGERTRGLFRQLGQYGVSVYPQHFHALYDAGALELLKDGSAILTDLSLYSDELGLTLEPDGGNGIFL